MALTLIGMRAYNPWRGCTRVSEGCVNCYSAAFANRFWKTFEVTRNSMKPESILSKRAFPSGEEIFLCSGSDFFHESADEWRQEIWPLIKQRPDLQFMLTTKRIERTMDCIPSDWGEGWANVTVSCTMENQRRVDERTPFLKKAPFAHKTVIVEPMLGPVNLSDILSELELVIVGGESGKSARLCNIDWVRDLSTQCKKANVAMVFKQTGASYFDGINHKARNHSAMWDLAQAYELDVISTKLQSIHVRDCSPSA